ncbi:MAG TPA: hypothetical protein VFX97_16985 [Pyrinomonadaceae bacterium]|nr:hypothetical protein [Pyrinomonadaceae bacterium]
MSEPMNDWLANLKAGDEVVVRSGSYGASLHVVERVTATQIILPRDSRYRRNDGRPVGASNNPWNILRLVEPTPELREKIRKDGLVEQLRRIVWEKINVDVLQEIFDKAKNGQHL